MRSMSALLPCPFCGGEPKRITLGPDDGPDNFGGDVISCTRCGASSHVEFGYKENLVSHWNTRTNNAPSLLEALQEARGYVENNHDEGCELDPEFGEQNFEGNLPDDYDPDEMRLPHCTCGTDELLAKIDDIIAQATGATRELD